MRERVLRYRSAGRQRGQAMVEMVVISLVLVALMLGIWYIGKFHDIQSSTIQAARYAAWERTARPASFTDTTLQSQTRARLFSWNQDPFRADDSIANNQQWNQQSTMWLDHASDKRLIDAPRDVAVSTAAGPLPGSAAAGVSNLLSGLDTQLAGLTGGEALPRGGKFTGTVSVRLANLVHMADPNVPLNNMNLTLTERAVVVGENWDAASPRQAALRTRAFTPGGVLKSIDTGFGSAIKSALATIEPAFNNFHPGQICPDVVPMDRIHAVTGAANVPVYKGAGPCY